MHIVILSKTLFIGITEVQGGLEFHRRSGFELMLGQLVAACVHASQKLPKM